jgi:3-oxoacyl-[acyl-carrier protein] reductase
MAPLAGKTAIITGAANGIGLAYAQRFAREGARIIIADLNETAGKTATERVAELGEVRFVRTDVSDPDSTEACAAAAVEAFGSLDILINNAALYGDWDMRDQSYAYLQRVFEVNQHGVWLMTRAVAPQMCASAPDASSIRPREPRSTTHRRLHPTTSSTDWARSATRRRSSGSWV